MNDESSSLARKLIDVHEYQIVAKARMPKMFYDFYASGAEDEWTLKENQKAFQRIWILPRIPLDVGKVELSTSILGFKVSSPIMIAPTALHKLAHPEGELATARAAIAADTIMVLSTTTSTSIEDVAAVGAGIRFFQLYIYKKTKTVELVRRAEEAGYKAIVLTVDSPVMGRREADLRNRFVFPPDVSMKLLEDVGNQQQLRTKTAESQLAAFIARNMDRSVTWKDVKWLQSITKLPVLLKGVLTAEATQHAIEAGVAGVIVSNHGARQLDYVSPTICALEEVVAAARGRIPVLFDGGIRRGTDVFKALALGACGVFVGRPVLFGLAVDGETGVKDVLEMLKDELEAAMNFASCFIVSDIRPTCIRSSFSRL